MTLDNILTFGTMGVWFVSEIVINISKRGKGLMAKKSPGKISNLLVLLIGVASVAVATFIGVLALSNDIRWLFSPIYAVSYTGLGIILLGVVIRCIAVIQLKRCFTVDVGIVEGHNLMTSGLYRFIRHPSYLGTLITFLGCGISYVNWLCVIILIVPNVIWAVMRMNEEEQVLAAHFGADYQAYVMRTKRLLPFIY